MSENPPTTHPSEKKGLSRGVIRRFMQLLFFIGAIVYSLAAPLMFGSWWAYVPAVLLATVILARTMLEDRTLQRELEGYADYTQRVRYRLLPGVW